MNSHKFVECSSPSYDRIEYGVKKTFHNWAVNLIHIFKIKKVDDVNSDSDKNNNTIQNTSRFAIYFENVDGRDLYWYFNSKEERDYNYEALMSVYASLRIKKENK